MIPKITIMIFFKGITTYGSFENINELKINELKIVI